MSEFLEGAKWSFAVTMGEAAALTTFRALINAKDDHDDRRRVYKLNPHWTDTTLEVAEYAGMVGLSFAAGRIVTNTIMNL